MYYTAPATANPEAQSYYFHLDSPEDRKVELSVQLKPISGEFLMCLSKTGNISDGRECTWVDYDYNYFVQLDSSSQDFQRVNKYGVLIRPVYKPNMEGKNFSYVLTLNSQESVGVLGNGIKLFLRNIQTYQNFKIPIGPESTGVTVVMTSTDPKALLQISDNSKDFYLKSPSNLLRSDRGKRAAFYIGKEGIDFMCPGADRSKVEPKHNLSVNFSSE